MTANNDNNKVNFNRGVVSTPGLVANVDGTLHEADVLQNKGVIGVEHNDTSKKVILALIIDTTYSQDETIEACKASLKDGVEALHEKLKKLDSINEVQIALFQQGKNNTKFLGLLPLSEVAGAMEKMECTPGATRISAAFEMLHNLESDATIPPVDAAITLGDSTDGDTKKDMIKTARQFGRPIITLLNRTQVKEVIRPELKHMKDRIKELEKAEAQLFGKPCHHNEYYISMPGTKKEHVQNMRAMSKASGVKNCPIPYGEAEFDYTKKNVFTDLVLKTALASKGPEVWNEAVEKGLIVAAPKELETYQSVADKSQRTSNWKRYVVGGGFLLLLPFMCRHNGDKHFSQTPQQKVFNLNAAPQILPTDTLKGKAFFAFNSDVITAEMSRELDLVVAKIKANAGKISEIVIVGSASAEGDAPLNQLLSEKRSAAVKDYIIENLAAAGITGVKIRYYGNGEQGLESESEAEKAQKRYAEINYYGEPLQLQNQ